MSCVFCGVNAPASHKLIPRSYVARLLERQLAASVSEPVIDLMRAQLAEEEEDIDDNCQETEKQLVSCMCCYYWVERRSTLTVAPLPMQKLLWFVRTLCWCESVCDSRVLQRLVLAIAEHDNIFACLFDESELHGLQQISREIAAARWSGQQTSRTQGDERFCIKRAIARLWRSENAHSLCLPHAAAADWLR